MENCFLFGNCSNCFVNKYKHLFNSAFTNNDEMQMLPNNVCCEQRENCKYNQRVIAMVYHYDIVLISIDKLKTEKNDGYERLPSDYFRHRTPLLYECNSPLFTCMIKHSFAPCTYGISTILPIHKGSNLNASRV